MTKQIDMGNNETLSTDGLFRNSDGTYTAHTLTRSKTFKTEKGARRWLSNNS